jgi:hypothetical protein
MQDNMLRIIQPSYRGYDPKLPKISHKERRKRDRLNCGKGRRKARPSSPYQYVEIWPLAYIY